MNPPLIRTERLHALLKDAARGAVNRHGDTVWLDGAAANYAQQLGVSALDVRGLLWWWSLRGTDRVQDCCLSPAGDAVLQQWETELWGPPTEPTRSRRPLTCLDDADFPLTAYDDRLMTLAAFEVTADDLETEQP
jgi:hypothetical protein